MSSAALFQPEAAPPQYRKLLPGDRIASMRQACGAKASFTFDTMAGRYHLLGFFLALDSIQIRDDIQAVLDRRDLFNDDHCSFTGVSITPGDRGLNNREPGIRFARDHDHSMARACGAVPLGSVPGEPMAVLRRWVVVDPSLHVLRVFPMLTTPVSEVIAYIEGLPHPDRFGAVHRPAPILMLPNVLEPDLCRRLIDIYETNGGAESGVHRDGVGVLDAGFKRRKD